MAKIEESLRALRGLNPLTYLKKYQYQYTYFHNFHLKNITTLALFHYPSYVHAFAQRCNLEKGVHGGR